MTRERATELSGDSELLFADGLDGALIGVFRKQGSPTVAAYSIELILDIFVSRDGMSVGGCR